MPASDTAFHPHRLDLIASGAKAASVPAALETDWTYRPSAPNAIARLLRVRDRAFRRGPAPASQVLVAPAGGGAWTLYFIWTPDGVLQPAHRFALERLRALDRRLLVVCAAPSAEVVPSALARAADALVWKDLPGFDFSGYAVGLAALARHVPGSDVLVLNDSTFGPLVDLRPWLARARWDLTGFTATANVENHVQSYAFHLRSVTPARMATLAPVLMPAHAFHQFWPVVFGQETRFARVASRSMSVGAFRYSPDPKGDPLLDFGLELVRQGFPFLKRSLLGKLSHLHPASDVEAVLRGAGYPI